MRACRMLVPETFSPRRAPECLVALAGSPPVPVAAAAVSWVAGGFPFQVHVAPPWRRRGIGRALVDAVATWVAGETDRLRSWSLVPEDGAAPAFLQALGFNVERRFIGYEAQSWRIAETIASLRGWLDRKGRIPAELQVVSLPDAPQQQVVRLAATELSIMPAALAARIAAQDTSGFSRELSVVLMLAGKVCGAILISRHQEMARVEVNVVAPEYRHGWANIVLLDESIRRGMAGGISRFRFFTDEKTRDTVNLGKRTGASVTGTGLLYERRLAPS